MSRVASILQPSYLPWLGAFDQMARSEVFVFLDDVQYTKNDWRNRNRIKSAGGASWLAVPVRTSGRSGQSIRDAEIEGGAWRRKHWRAISQAYSKAPHWNRYSDEIDGLLDSDWTRISELDIAVTRWMADAFGIEVEFRVSSELGVEADDPNERLLAVLEAVGADEWYEGAAGASYVDLERFRRHGVRVRFQDYSHPEYPQLWPRHGFISHLSALDLLLNCGPDGLSILLSGGAGGPEPRDGGR